MNKKLEKTDNTEELLTRALGAIGEAKTKQQLDQLRINYLGKKGEITRLQRMIGQLAADERKEFGQATNSVKQKIVESLDEKANEIEQCVNKELLDVNKIDVTLPGIRRRLGRLHPLTQVTNKMKNILIGLGFQYEDYPELETEYYNFESLNTPHWHPARDLQDSFYTTDGKVPRTHTTAFMVHAMETYDTPPIKAMTSGRCYRRDKVDASHTPIFHQIDGIAIDKNIAFSDLKWTLFTLFSNLFEKDVELRFRPSYFPFTTPSAEVDMSCTVCGGKGCNVCKHTGWLELLGAGMIRPEVLRAGEIDPEEYQGFAFGIGIERVTMVLHGIDDIRLFFSNSYSFLEQF